MHVNDSVRTARVQAIIIWLSLFAVNCLGNIHLYGNGYYFVDQSQIIYHLKEWAYGRVPYLDSFNYHFLGSLVPLYIVERLVGFTPDVYLFVGTAYNFLNAILCFWIISRIAGRKLAYLAALFVVTAGWFLRWQGDSFNFQSTYLPFIYLLIALTVEANLRKNVYFACAAAFCFGILATFDQRLLPFALVLTGIVYTFRRDQPLKMIFVLAFCGLVYPFLCISYLAWHGALPALYFQVVEFPFTYRNATGSESGIQAVRALLWLMLRTETIVITFALLGATLVFRNEKNVGLRVSLLATLVAGAIAALAAGRNYLNYTIFLVPSLTLLAILVIHYTTRNFSRLRAALAATLIGCCIFSWVPRFYTLAKIRLQVEGASWNFSEPQDVMNAARDFINIHSKEKEDVLVWGYAPQIYLLAEKFSPFRDVGLYTVAGSNYKEGEEDEQKVVEALEKEFIHMLNTNPPLIIINIWRKFYFDEKLSEYSGLVYLPNYDFKKVARLRYLKETLADKYELKDYYENTMEAVEMYLRR